MVVEAITQTAEERERETIPESRLKIALGLHKESKIDLYTLELEGKPQVSVFVYPQEYILNPSKITKIDTRFRGDITRVITREFKDTSVEDLNATFLNDARPAISLMDHTYDIGREATILEHSFQDGSQSYLESVIKDIKCK